MADDRIRLTVALSPETHAIFVAMSKTAGVSLSRCIGDWLADTSEGAHFVAQKMADARAAPRVVMREMQAFTRGLVDEVDELAEKVRRAPPSAVRSAAVGGAEGASSPRPVIRGGNSIEKMAKQGRKS